VTIDQGNYVSKILEQDKLNVKLNQLKDDRERITLLKEMLLESEHNNKLVSEMEAELEKAKKLESIAALSGGIAHDYNNLLTVIIGNISLARTLIKDNEKVLALLSEAQKASRIAKELTKRLITFSKGGVPTKSLAQIEPLIRSATEFSLSGSNVNYEFLFDKDLWPVAIDKSQIGQAIHNIIINADEAMLEGGNVLVSVRNTEINKEKADLKPGNYVKITIADSGIGIPEENITRIFDPYFSTKEMGTQKGMGLGLSIAHSIVQKHDGDIHVNSTIGNGATFTVYLPAADENQSIPPEDTRRKKKPAMSSSLKGSGKILLMDDEAMIRNVGKSLLNHLGYDAEFAAHGEKAIAMYEDAMQQGEPFDVVILDLTIRGGMGGEETIKKLLEIDPEVKAIVSSGYANTPVVQNFRDYGFCANISKPYNLSKMGHNLNKILSS